MRIYEFLGDRGEIVGVAALVKGQRVELEDELGAKLIAEEFPIREVAVPEITPDEAQ
jgi:hypothetical protein